MTEREIKNLICSVSSVCVFRKVLATPVMESFLGFLRAENDEDRISLFGEFVCSLSAFDFSFSEFLKKSVCEDDNYYIRGVSHGVNVPQSVETNKNNELKIFSRLTELKAEDFFGAEEYAIPQFENEKTDFVSLYTERMKSINKYGYGIFSGAGMFNIVDSEIRPIESADKISLDSFIGYEAERMQVFENTRALAEGRFAANALLCGDAGTGKSSTVKACANYFYSQGVRLIEVRKDQLFSLPYIMGKIADNPLKFIIFIDDLSFNKNDDCFSMLKAALEGSAAAKADNAVIYATSNRRHIVKESFKDRENDDVHHNDTVQELLSLSERFGLTVYFERPNKSLYLDIVHAMAEKSNIQMEQNELDILAERFALGRSNRSPRTAEQFVQSLEQKQ